MECSLSAQETSRTPRAATARRPSTASPPPHPKPPWDWRAWGLGAAGWAGQLGPVSLVPQTTASTHPPAPPPDPRGTKGSPRPQVAFSFSETKHGKVGRAAPWPCPSLCVGGGRAQVLDWHPPLPPKIKESGLESFSNKSWGSPCPCRGAATQTPNHLLGDLPSKRLPSPHTPPKRGSKKQEGNNLLAQGCPVGRGVQPSGTPPPPPSQPGLAQGEFPNPPERPLPRAVRDSEDQAGFPLGRELLGLCSPKPLIQTAEKSTRREIQKGGYIGAHPAFHSGS